MRYSMSEIAAVCGGQFIGRDVTVSSVIADSRRSTGADEQPLFVAIAGRNHDGHDFIDDLYRRGVRGFVIEKDIETERYPEAGFVITDKSLHALQALAAHYRRRFKGVMVGITGSNGKTTVKEWIARAVQDGTTIFRSPRSYNSQLGVPLSVLMMRGDEDIALIEAGISRPGEMERLAEIIRPDFGVFTALGPEHGENFSSSKQKMKEKALLFAGCRSVVYNGNEPLVGEVLRDRLQGVKLTDAAVYDNLLDDIKDDVSRRNAAIVAAFYNAAGYNADALIQLLPAMKPAETRLGIREAVAGSLLVTDMNNTDINSLPISLDYVKGVAGGRRSMLIMTDIPFNPMPDWELYGKVAAMLRSADIGLFVGIGERISACSDAFSEDSLFFDSAEDFIRHTNQSAIEDSAILLRGNPEPQFFSLLHHLDRRSHTTVLEVNLDAMIHNMNYFRSGIGAGVKLMAMVKASGYGTGNYEVAEMLRSQGVDYLAVAFADEGVRLREQGIAMPIVVLNADADSFALMVANRLEPEIYNRRSLAQFIASVRDAGETSWPVHIKIDSGMHRLGFEEKDIDGLVSILRRESGSVVVRSVFSHLAVADVPEEDDFTRGQIAVFSRCAEMLAVGIGYKPLMHLSNSAGMERFPEARFDMCRIGIGLYGVSAQGQGILRPVSRLATRIVQIKELDADQTIGYGRAGKLYRSSRIATIPIGYADGFDRRLGCGNWNVFVGGTPAPIIGRICMDSCMVDVTDVPVAEGDEVTVFGSAPGNTVEDMACLLGTIPYEIMTSVSERVKRIYLKE